MVHGEGFLQTIEKCLEICYWINVVVIHKIVALVQGSDASCHRCHDINHDQRPVPLDPCVSQKRISYCSEWAFSLLMRNFPCWKGYLSKFLIFLCEPGRARFAETNNGFFPHVVSRKHSMIFFSANLALQVRFTNLSTAGSFFEPHACAALANCRPPRLFQQGKSLLWKIRNLLCWEGHVYFYL